jgi:hypothetical protein
MPINAMVDAGLGLAPARSPNPCLSHFEVEVTIGLLD